jgi:hypothetical protein
MNLQKIGVMIRRGRLLKLNASHHGDYGPKGFIICSTEHPFFDVQPGYPVCTRPTLLRLEQGKDIQEEELYRFFLHKLGLSYAFSMRREKRYDQFCFDFAQCVADASLADIAKLMLPEVCGSNLLYDFYDRLLCALHGFFTEAAFPSIAMMEEISDLCTCIPAKLLPITRIFVMTAMSAHPFYDRIRLNPLLTYDFDHPLDKLSCAMVALNEERYMMAFRLLESYDAHPCSGELAILLRSQIDRFISTILRKGTYRLPPLIENEHPVARLFRAATVFQLGKYAVLHRDFAATNICFDALAECGEPWGIFAAFITHRLYPKEPPSNPKLRNIVAYLQQSGSTSPECRLDLLMKQVLPSLGKEEEFLRVSIRFEMIRLIHSTQRYKYAFDYLKTCG